MNSSDKVIASAIISIALIIIVVIVSIMINGVHSRNTRKDIIATGVSPLEYLCLDRGMGYDNENAVVCMEIIRNSSSD